MSVPRILLGESNDIEDYFTVQGLNLLRINAAMFGISWVIDEIYLNRKIVFIISKSFRPH